MNIIHYQKSERESNFVRGSKFGIWSVVLSEVNCPKCQEATEQECVPNVLHSGHCEHVPDWQYCPYCKEA